MPFYVDQSRYSVLFGRNLLTFAVLLALGTACPAVVARDLGPGESAVVNAGDMPEDWRLVGAHLDLKDASQAGRVDGRDNARIDATSATLGSVTLRTGSHLRAESSVIDALVLESGATAALRDGWIGDGGLQVRGIGTDARLTGTTVQTGADDRHAVLVEDGANLVLAEIKARPWISTWGRSAHGLLVRGASASTDDVQVQTMGAGSHALFAEAGAMVRATGAGFNRFDAYGEGAHGAWLSDSTLQASNTIIYSERAAGLSIDRAVVSMDGWHSGLYGNGVSIEFRSDAVSSVQFGGSTLVGGDIRFAAGAIDADGNGQLDRTSSVRLRDNVLWSGATDAVGALSISGTAQWHIAADSSIGSLTMVGGSVAFDPRGGSYKRLTVEGDFLADDGLLYFNVALGDDHSPGDQLHVRGDTSGTARIWVENTGGHGGLTREGIRLIEIDGVSNGRYTLDRRVVAGTREYFLFQGGKLTPDDGDWYLRSELPPTGDSCGSAPDRPGCEASAIAPRSRDVGTLLPQGATPPQPQPVLRPEPGAYLANQAAAVQMFGQRHHDGSATADGQGAWARVGRTQARYGVIGNQLSVNGDSSTLQVGSEVWAWGDGRGQVGVMAGHGTANATVTSRLTGYAARAKLTGKAFGVYASWAQQQDAGLYLDGALQYARFDNAVHGEGLAKERFGSRASTLAAEAGYGVRLLDNGRSVLVVEPQLQLSYRRYAAERITETNGTVIDGGGAGGLSSRVGVRVSGHATTGGGSRVQPFVAVSLIRESSENRLSFDGDRLAGGLPKSRYEARGGAQLRLGPHWSGWGDIGLQRGDGGYREVAGQIGLRANW